MKHNHVIAGILFALFVLVITACGGGGGAPTTNGGTYTSIRMEAVLEGTSTSIDPTNVFTNEQVRFRLTGVDENLIRVVIPTSGYVLTGSPGGTLDSTGLFSASGSPTGFTGSVTVVFDSNSYSSQVKVVSPQAIISGVGRLPNGAPARGVQILALNAGGSVVGVGTVATTGAIRFSAPTTAVRFTASFTNVDPGPNFFYVRQFAYNSLDYSTTIASCTAPLPVLTNGLTSNLATHVVFYSIAGGSPPPPPDGCQ